MRKIITAALGSMAVFAIMALVAPTARALVPPEPAGPTNTPAASIDTGVSLMSWQTAIVAVIAVAVGAAVALAVEHYVRRDRPAGLVAA
jgi:hypothetical protein